MEAKFAFECKTPEIFDTLDEAQAAIDNNPLPFHAMKYIINEGVFYKGGYVPNVFIVGTFGANDNWFGFLNTKFKEVG